MFIGIESKWKIFNSIIKKLDFYHSHRIEATGFSRGIWVRWKENIHIRISFSHPQFMLLLVFGNVGFNSIFIFFVYVSPNKRKPKALWDELSHVFPKDHSLYLVMGDFNAILSLND